MAANKNLLIYVVEDNKLYNRLVTNFLGQEGYTNIKSFLTGKECVDAVNQGEKPQIIIQDYHLDDTNGIAVLQAVKKKNKETEFVFLTANEDMEVAVNTIKYGAYDYIIKDSDVAMKKVANKIEKICKVFELQQRNFIIKRVMVITFVLLVAIVIVALLHTFFNIFGVR